MTDVVHSLQLGGAGSYFPFTEDETRRVFSYLSGTLRVGLSLCNRNLCGDVRREWNLLLAVNEGNGVGYSNFDRHKASRMF